ncbi:MAG: hypothetical protein NW208_06655 [Bryobacter sp.]|nr:hypothetical protein [Bryobacter sp.]
MRQLPQVVVDLLAGHGQHFGKTGGGVGGALQLGKDGLALGLQQNAGVGGIAQHLEGEGGHGIDLATDKKSCHEILRSKKRVTHLLA